MHGLKSFRTLNAPFVAAIVQERSVEATIANIMNAEHDGAKGFMVDLSFLPDSGRTPEALHRIFTASGRPMMPLVYRSGNMQPDRISEDDRVQLMLNALDAGASSIDVMGNLFEPDAPRELARDAYAVKRQVALIEKLHACGAEVLMSSHMMEVLSAEEVLKHLMCQAERGADIAKIITACNTWADLEESVRTLNLLREKMRIPYIYLCNGKMGRLQRFFAPSMGSMLNFGVTAYNEISQGAQPTIRSAVTVMHEMSWHIDD